MTTDRRRSGPKPKPLAERFWTKVDKTGDCWLWTGHKMYKGYGVFSIAANVDGVPGSGLRRAHRLSFELAYGPIPDDMLILHSCDVRACVRPEHLRVGTWHDNVRDQIERGRHPNRLKTHCPQGHPYTGNNLVTRKNGVRECRTCINTRQRNRKQGSSD